MHVANSPGNSNSCNVVLQKRNVENLDWDLVRVFREVGHSGRLALAATRLGLDISTVSRRLDKLEEVLGMTLCERGREGVVITEAGERLLPAAEEMAHAMAGLGMAVNAVEAEAEGIVRLAALPGVADMFIAPALGRFHAAHPRVRIDLDVSVGYADLTRGEADLAVRTRRPTRGDLVAQKLVSTRSVPAASPAYARALGKTPRWIGWGADLTQIPEAQWLAANVTTPLVLRTSSFGAQLAAAAAGLGVVLAPEPYLAPCGLVPIARSKKWTELPTSNLWLVGHLALRRVPRVAVLWDFLVEEFTRAAL